MQSDIAERRRAPRIELKQPVQIRPIQSWVAPEACPTLNVSESGLYCGTSCRHARETNVYATGEFQSGSLMNRSIVGSIVRVEELETGKFGSAIQIQSGK
jgi:hypothetical protein